MTRERPNDSGPSHIGQLRGISRVTGRGFVSGSRQDGRANGELVRRVDGAKRNSVRAFRQLFLAL